jgi:hypothetical protein
MEGPGIVVLFGSGEIAPNAQRVYDWVMRQLEPPIRVSVLETPAGFELNSGQVASRIGDYLVKRLQNYDPVIEMVPARKKGTAFSPDDPDIIEPLWRANMLFMGPGSPTYAVRQLENSLAWHALLARHRLGAAVALASAATISVGAYALPVYEIYKVGQDIHWKKGLNFFEPFGLSPLFVPHWNNNEGGEDLDTSRCFMGKSRFHELSKMLPEEQLVVGIDEHTALVMDMAAKTCRVLGVGAVTIRRGEEQRRYETGQDFSMSEFCDYRLPKEHAGIPDAVWEQALEEQARLEQKSTPEPPAEVTELVAKREEARAEQDWETADAIRDQVADLGWQIKDTPAGSEVEPL